MLSNKKILPDFSRSTGNFSGSFINGYRAFLLEWNFYFLHCFIVSVIVNMNMYTYTDDCMCVRADVWTFLEMIYRSMECYDRLLGFEQQQYYTTTHYTPHTKRINKRISKNKHTHKKIYKHTYKLHLHLLINGEMNSWSILSKVVLRSVNTEEVKSSKCFSYSSWRSWHHMKTNDEDE